jgi:eukaryotic-like serine/threonine-protein kinase
VSPAFDPDFTRSAVSYGMTDVELTTLRTRLGSRYYVERLLGRGGMGAVYLARELQLDRQVALKVLPTSLADDGVLRDRFLRETRLAASFSHPNIVPVHAVEEQEDLLAFAMGFVEGESLAEHVARSGPFTSRQTVRLLQDVAYALAYAHARGVVHRDIKPDNIMIERATGRALVMDFGIARRASSAPQPADGLTRVGQVVGTPEYMSPEQATGDVIDGRSDLYSLGLVAWFALTGRTAMEGETTQQVLVRQITEVLPPMGSERPDIPQALAVTIDRCLAKEPSQRFDDAAALVNALEQAELAGPEIPLPVRMLANELGTIGILVFFTAAITWFMLTRLLEASDMDDVDNLIPVVVLITVVFARLGQTLGETQRLATLGFDHTAVMSGLRSVVDEAEGMRAAARVDAERLVERRKAVRTAWIMLAIGVASVAFAFTQRRLVAPHLWRTGPLGVAFLFNGLACICVAFVLWLRSPLRMPPGERAFRAFWLHGPGGWLLSLVMRRSRPASASPRKAGTARTAPRALASVSVPDARMQKLEHRVEALEHWRERGGD